jgi:hypothetical protein
VDPDPRRIGEQDPDEGDLDQGLEGLRSGGGVDEPD